MSIKKVAEKHGMPNKTLENKVQEKHNKIIWGKVAPSQGGMKILY